MLIEVADRQGDVALRAKLEVAARRRQKELRKQAYALAERLFAETPRAFRLRMACYWAAKGKLAVNAAHDPADRT